MTTALDSSICSQTAPTIIHKKKILAEFCFFYFSPRLSQPFTQSMYVHEKHTGQDQNVKIFSHRSLSVSYGAWDKGGWITEPTNYLHWHFLRHREQENK